MKVGLQSLDWIKLRESGRIIILEYLYFMENYKVMLSVWIESVFSVKAFIIQTISTDNLLSEFSEYMNWFSGN